MGNIKTMTDEEVMRMLGSRVPASKEIETAHRTANEMINESITVGEEEIVRLPSEDRTISDRIHDAANTAVYFGGIMLAIPYLCILRALDRK